MKITNIQKKIKIDLIPVLSENGFVFIDSAFYCHETDLIKIIHLQYPNTNMANYFGTNTASFFICLGIFYNFIPLDHKIAKDKDKKILLPKDYECHIRKTLFRDFEQKIAKKPNNIGKNDAKTIQFISKWLFEKFPSLKPEKNNRFLDNEQNRKDIWYIEKDGSNLDFVIANAKRVIFEEGMAWFDKFSNLSYTYKYLQEEETGNMYETFGFTKKGTLVRNRLLKYFEKRLNKNK